jgi:hypothetical protein
MSFKQIAHIEKSLPFSGGLFLLSNYYLVTAIHLVRKTGHTGEDMGKRFLERMEGLPCRIHLFLAVWHSVSAVWLPLESWY